MSRQGEKNLLEEDLQLSGESKENNALIAAAENVENTTDSKNPASVSLKGFAANLADKLMKIQKEDEENIDRLVEEETRKKYRAEYESKVKIQVLKWMENEVKAEEELGIEDPEEEEIVQMAIKKKVDEEVKKMKERMAREEERKRKEKEVLRKYEKLIEKKVTEEVEKIKEKIVKKPKDETETEDGKGKAEKKREYGGSGERGGQYKAYRDSFYRWDHRGGRGGGRGGYGYGYPRGGRGGFYYY